MLEANSVDPNIPAGIVSSVIDTNNFNLLLGGYLSGLSGLTPGDMYYVSDTTAGALVTSPPTAYTSATIPVMIAITSTAGFVNFSRDLAPVDFPHFQGYVSIQGPGSGTPVTLANPIIYGYDTQNNYSQSNIQNLSSGANASSDWVATADTGTDTTNYIDLGINGSGYSSGSWTINGPTDGYLYTQSSNLAIGTAASGKNVVLFAGGTLSTNAVMTLSSSAITVNVPITGYATTSSIPTQYTSTPSMDGVAASGSTGYWSDGGHTHPSDTSRLAVSAQYTGSPWMDNITGGVAGSSGQWSDGYHQHPTDLNLLAMAIALS